ncbi:MAG: ATP-binding cassette domain-containing protein, partial [Bacteroidia bacterium]
IESPEEDNSAINIRFRMAQVSGKIVSEITDVSKSFPDVEILKHASGTILRGDKIALIGANGKGKSTLLRMIAGTEKFEGTITTGYNVKSAFYAQHQLEALHMQNEVLQELQQSGSDRTEAELRTLLGCFLFEGDDVFKKIKVLSGGEKSRVALAKILIAEANFLMLDEPTNHLDMRSIDILTEALQKYPGTIILVSHDRYFISRVANKIWWLEDHELKEYPGTYAEFEYWKKKQAEVEELKLKQEKSKPAAKKTEAKVQQKKNENKNNTNRKQKLQKQFEFAEQQISELAKEIKTSENELVSNQNKMNKEEFLIFQKNYENLKTKLAEKEKEYESLFNEIVKLEES